MQIITIAILLMRDAQYIEKSNFLISLTGFICYLKMCLWMSTIVQSWNKYDTKLYFPGTANESI